MFKITSLLLCAFTSVASVQSACASGRSVNQLQKDSSYKSVACQLNLDAASAARVQRIGDALIKDLQTFGDPDFTITKQSRPTYPHVTLISGENPAGESFNTPQRQAIQDGFYSGFQSLLGSDQSQPLPLAMNGIYAIVKCVDGSKEYLTPWELDQLSALEADSIIVAGVFDRRTEKMLNATARGFWPVMESQGLLERKYEQDLMHVTLLTLRGVHSANLDEYRATSQKDLLIPFTEAARQHIAQMLIAWCESQGESPIELMADQLVVNYMQEKSATPKDRLLDRQLHRLESWDGGCIYLGDTAKLELLGNLRLKAENVETFIQNNPERAESAARNLEALRSRIALLEGQVEAGPSTRVQPSVDVEKIVAKITKQEKHIRFCQGKIAMQKKRYIEGRAGAQAEIQKWENKVQVARATIADLKAKLER